MAPTLFTVLKSCIELERKAAGFYARLSTEDPSAERKGFWMRMAEQEGRHVSFWTRLLELSDRGGLPSPFDDPAAVLGELEAVKRQAEAVAGRSQAWDPVVAFLSAYRMEILLLHPALPALFWLAGKAAGDLSQALEYRAHLEGLAAEARRSGVDHHALSVLADLLERHWSVQESLARRTAELRDLRALVPICSYCKNVRNDKGYWEKVERYVEARTPAEFSHGICPDCIRKHFPEFADDPEVREAAAGRAEPPSVP
jgi:hypothetical protein